MKKENMAYFYYYNLLTPDEKRLYIHLLNALSSYHYGPIRFDSHQDRATVHRVVDSLHFDHPAELFHVHFTQYKLIKRGRDIVGVEFQMLCEQMMIDHIRHELELIPKSLHRRLQQTKRLEEKYIEIVRLVATTTKYRESGNFFIDHSLTGPAVTGEGVCEGLAKYFLFLCQSQGLPCCIVLGATGGGRRTNHAWNKVYLRGGEIRYVDPTAFIKYKCLTVTSVFKTKEEMMQNGYAFTHYLSA